MEPVTFKQMISQVPVRFAELLVKLFSVKGVILGLSIWLGLTGFFDPVHVLIVFGVVIFGREFFKLYSQMKR